ncbi:MAG TPA: response regulator transcription factor [Tichowtungia sp.]|nr:response regulator transcription factor [Tichowtungia sp.]
MKNKIRLMLIEDSEDYRKGIICALDTKPDIKMISQYATAEIALRNLQEPAGKNRPDIILLDLNLPGMSGLDAVPLIRQQVPDVKIIILTQSDKEADVLRAIRLGASGYLLKSASVSSLIEGIELVYSGGATLDSHLAGFILNTLSERLPEVTPNVPLSKRETDVLTLIAEGEAQKQIAAQLDISTYTVSEYINNIYSKLEVHNAPAAVAKAYRSGILPSDRSPVYYKAPLL